MRLPVPCSEDCLGSGFFQLLLFLQFLVACPFILTSYVSKRTLALHGNVWDCILLYRLCYMRHFKNVFTSSCFKFELYQSYSLINSIRVHFLFLCVLLPVRVWFDWIFLNFFHQYFACLFAYPVSLSKGKLGANHIFLFKILLMIYKTKGERQIREGHRI